MMLGYVVTQPYYVGYRISCSDLGFLQASFKMGASNLRSNSRTVWHVVQEGHGVWS
jgi:hypothetical protein